MNKTTKIRFIAMGLDMWIFLLMSLLLMLTESRLFILSLILSYILYFGVVPMFSKGQTFSGMIFGLKIIKIDKKTLNVWEYLHRALSATTTVVLSMWRLKINSLGQTNYDEKFQTIVIKKKSDIATITASEYFILPYFLIATVLFFSALGLLSFINQFIR